MCEKKKWGGIDDTTRFLTGLKQEKKTQIIEPQKKIASNITKAKKTLNEAEFFFPKIESSQGEHKKNFFLKITQANKDNGAKKYAELKRDIIGHD